MTLTLLLGGVRAGKSARALSLASDAAGTAPVLFVATAQAFDDEMRRRIDVHRAERPSHWATLEASVALPGAIDTFRLGATEAYPVVVVDCLTLWVSNLLLTLADDDDAEAFVAGHVRALLRVMRESADAAHWIVVSNEVGLGIVPPTPLGRRYRDALGRANQLVAAAADTVTLMVAGLELPLKPPPPSAHR
jgi:adenosylcobinamide kinase/adenosylcobinamide-phosphate guanylyltransferase